jgi:hypothetical protein
VALLNPRPSGAAEIELLLCAAHPHPSPTRSERLRALLDPAAPDLDWDRLLRAAQRHEQGPLLHRLLKAAPTGSVPDAVRHHLQEQATAVAVRNLFLATELLRLLQRLRARAVLAVPFKGPVLAAAAYGSPALRQFVDLDILVDGRDVPRTVRLLERDGYRPRFPLHGLRRLIYLQSEASFDFVRADGLVTVEVHWGLMPRYFGFALGLDSVRDRLVTADLSGTPVPSLPAEDLLLFLCLHGTKHRWSSLKWIGDVAALVAAEEALDWDAVWSRAAALGGERMLRLGLLLATGLLGAGLPPHVDRRLRRDPVAAALAAEVAGELFRPGGPRPGAGNRFYLRAMTSPWRRARYCLHLATIPTLEDWQRLPLPPGLALLHYPLHVAWLAGRAVRAAGSALVAGLPAASSRSRRTARPRLPTVKA